MDSSRCLNYKDPFQFLVACQIVKDNMSVAWPYMKVECAPPMTMSLLQGPLGNALESTVSGVANGFMNAIKAQINSMDAAVERKKRESEAAIIAAQEKAKAEELKKKLEAENKALDAKLKQEAVALKKKEVDKKDDKKASPEPAKKDPPKAQKAPPAKKDEKKDPKKK